MHDSFHFLADCGSLQDPDHGMVHTTDGTKLESIATYTCDGGYVLTYPASRVCLDDCKWSGVAPTCEPIGKYWILTSTTLSQSQSLILGNTSNNKVGCIVL